MARNSVVTVRTASSGLKCGCARGASTGRPVSGIPEFTVAQLVSLRFASDAELPALARKVLDEKLKRSQGYQQLVKDWQADYLRA